MAITAFWLCAQLALAASPFAAWCCEPAATASPKAANGEHVIVAADPHAHGADTHGTPADEDECCKGLGPGQVCPLHKYRKPKASSQTAAHSDASHHEGSSAAAKTATSPAAGRRCEMRATCDPSNAAPVPVLFEARIVPTAFVLLHAPTVAIVPDLTVTALVRAERPDSPPPRG